MKFESPIAAALNHLLDSEPWARERLAPFAGRRWMRAPPLPALRFLVAADGRLSTAAPRPAKDASPPLSSHSVRARSQRR